MSDLFYLSHVAISSLRMRGLLVKSVVIILTCLFPISPLTAQPLTPAFVINGTDPEGRTGTAVACIDSFVASNQSSVAVGSPGTGASILGLVEVRDGATGTQIEASVEAGDLSSRFGNSITSLGDSRLGNTLSDLLVGAPSDNPAAFASRITLMAGPDGNITYSSIGSIGVSTDLGRVVAPAFFDMDTNSAPDFLAGAPNSINGGEVILEDRFSTGPMRLYSAPQVGARFGSAITSMQDVDGDGLRDILIGAPGRDLGLSDQGSVIAMNADTGATIWEITGPAANDQFGASISNLGDLDGDGNEEFLVGAPSDANGPGSAFVYTNDQISPIVRCVLQGAAPGDGFGKAVSALGDIDQDGLPEFGVGAPSANSAQGELHIFQFEPATGFCLLKMTLTGNAPGDEFGSALAAVLGPSNQCNLNGDTIADFGVGSPGIGRASFFFGAPFPTPTPTVTPTSTAVATPTETPTVTPTPTLPPHPNKARFSFKIREDGIFTATNTLDADPLAEEPCFVSVYARTSRYDLSDVREVFTVKRRALQIARIGRFRTRGFQRAVCDLSGKPYSIHLISETRCGSRRFFSNVFARQMSCGLAPPLSRSAWETQLQQKLAAPSQKRRKSRKH